MSGTSLDALFSVLLRLSKDEVSNRRSLAAITTTIRNFALEEEIVHAGCGKWVDLNCNAMFGHSPLIAAACHKMGGNRRRLPHLIARTQKTWALKWEFLQRFLCEIEFQLLTAH